MENHKEKLRVVLEEYWKKPLPLTKERKTKLEVKTDLINDIIGIRRSGKTYLMFLTIKNLLEKGVDKKATLYINFENRRLLPLTPEYLNDIVEIIYEEMLLKKHKKLYVFLDEVQRIKDWEQYLRSIFDEFKGRIKLFVSGSTSRLTKSEIAHLLSGRHLTTRVMPLDFMELLKFRNLEYGKVLTEEEKSGIMRLLKEYLEFGGFPEVVINNNKEQILETLFLDIISRDITPKVKHRGTVEEMAYFLCSYSGKLMSFSKLEKILNQRGIKLSVPTVEKYFNLMKDSFLFFDNPVFSYRVKDQLQYPRKIYCVDTGFVNYFGFRFSEDKGRIMENLVAVELLRRDPKDRIFYWKDYTGKEVDFVVKRGVKIKRLIQACYTTEDFNTKERELKALVKASKELKCSNLLVITWDYDAEEKFKGKRIKFIPLWKFLLHRTKNL